MQSDKTLDQLRKLIDQITPEIATIRREIHAHPELGFEEHDTSKRVADWLDENGLKVQKNIATTGVVGLLSGKQGGKTVALRADMDALPISESSGVPYASKVNGKAHACGHDGHTAILMGTAKLLSKVRSEFQGNVKFIFQPAEEGGGGGDKMCREGVLENPKVDAIFGLHGWPDLNAGEIGVKYGAMMANSDRFDIIMKGRGGHAARPHKAIDPIVMSAKVIDGLQTIVSRTNDPLRPAVITVGKIQGGSTHNVIPDTATLAGTIRTLDQDTRERIFHSIKQVADSVAKMFGAPDPVVEIRKGYPALVNHDEMTRLVQTVGQKTLNDKVKILEEPSMGGEDFSYYLQKVPGAFFRLGLSAPNVSKSSLHSASFNFNDDAIPTGMLMFACIVYKFLNN